jgi:hypothetical protein
LDPRRRTNDDDILSGASGTEGWGGDETEAGSGGEEEGSVFDDAAKRANLKNQDGASPMMSLSIHVGGGAAAAKSPPSRAPHNNQQQRRKSNHPSASVSPPQMMMMQRTQAFARKGADGMCLFGQNLIDLVIIIDAAAAASSPQCNVCGELIIAADTERNSGLCCGDATNNKLCAENSVICCMCFGKFSHNSQFALHLSWELKRKLAGLSLRPLVVEDVVSANAVATPAAAVVDAGGGGADRVLTTAQIVAKEKEQIVNLYKTCLAFVSNVNSSGQGVTRESIFKNPRWDLQALKTKRGVRRRKRLQRLQRLLVRWWRRMTMMKMNGFLAATKKKKRTRAWGTRGS